MGKEKRLGWKRREKEIVKKEGKDRQDKKARN